jgi:PilZ domain
MPNKLAPPQEGEITFIERRDDRAVQPRAGVDAIVGKQGQYTLRSWRDASGKPREFQCVVKKIASEFIELTAPITGSVGEWVVAYFDSFGQFEGPITHTYQNYFVMWIVATAEKRKKIASKIAWAKDKKSHNRRRHERFVPRNPDAILHFSDGRSMPCKIIDYSISGVAVSADSSVEVGAVIKVGNIIGQVIRRFSEGFTVKFLIVQNSQTIANLFAK